MYFILADLQSNSVMLQSTVKNLNKEEVLSSVTNFDSPVISTVTMYLRNGKYVSHTREQHHPCDALYDVNIELMCKNLELIHRRLKL